MDDQGYPKVKDPKLRIWRALAFLLTWELIFNRESWGTLWRNFTFSKVGCGCVLCSYPGIGPMSTPSILHCPPFWGHSQTTDSFACVAIRVLFRNFLERAVTVKHDNSWKQTIPGSGGLPSNMKFHSQTLNNNQYHQISSLIVINLKKQPLQNSKKNKFNSHPTITSKNHGNKH